MIEFARLSRKFGVKKEEALANEKFDIASREFGRASAKFVIAKQEALAVLDEVGEVDSEEDSEEESPNDSSHKDSHNKGSDDGCEGSLSSKADEGAKEGSLSNNEGSLVGSDEGANEGSLVSDEGSLSNKESNDVFGGGEEEKPAMESEAAAVVHEGEFISSGDEEELDKMQLLTDLTDKANIVDAGADGNRARVEDVNNAADLVESSRGEEDNDSKIGLALPTQRTTVLAIFANLTWPPS